MNTFYMILSFIAWAVAHSWLATFEVKQQISAKLSAAWLTTYYRFAYNVFAAISFLPVLYFLSLDGGVLLYEMPGIIQPIAYAIQAAMLVLMVYSVFQTGLLQFVGLKPQVDKPDQAVFVATGMFKLVRHPIYTTSLIFLWVKPIVNSSTLVFTIIITIYILIGIQFEERRLLREFGDLYRDYKTRTPMLIPFTKK
jgi:protein-S-isoprenylcysteine O-methyltransferase Ste14